MKEGGEVMSARRRTTCVNIRELRTMCPSLCANVSLLADEKRKPLTNTRRVRIHRRSDRLDRNLPQFQSSTNCLYGSR